MKSMLHAIENNYCMLDFDKYFNDLVTCHSFHEPYSLTHGYKSHRPTYFACVERFIGNPVLSLIRV